MSLFATQLEVCLQHARLNRRELSDRCGIPYRTLSNYAADISAPDVEALRKICGALPDDERPALIAARAADEVPVELRSLVWIEPRTNTLGEAPPAPFYPRELPNDLRQALEKLAAAATENAEWKNAVLALSELA